VNRPPRGAASTRGGGFTLVEVAVVIVMVGVLAAVALVFVKPGSAAASARGYADEVAALCDAVRQRAIAAHTYERIEVEAGGVVHWQFEALDAGPNEPSDPIDPAEWKQLGVLPVPADVVVGAVSIKTHIRANEPIEPDPDDDNLPAQIIFTPDGSARAPATIFVEDSRSENRARVAIYPATGSVYAYREW
jgi:prepilin-type N-terminal cleavage/methylation domain-containing protein